MKEKIEDIGFWGGVGGIIAWLAIMRIVIKSSACLRLDNCDGGDMLLIAIIGIGMLVPAYPVALFSAALANFISDLFAKDKDT